MELARDDTDDLTQPPFVGGVDVLVTVAHLKRVGGPLLANLPEALDEGVASSSVMMPVLASARVAMLPRMSSCAMRRSKERDSLNFSISGSMSSEKRPPHSFFFSAAIATKRAPRRGEGVDAARRVREANRGRADTRERATCVTDSAITREQVGRVGRRRRSRARVCYGTADKHARSKAESTEPKPCRMCFRWSARRTQKRDRIQIFNS